MLAGDDVGAAHAGPRKPRTAMQIICPNCDTSYALPPGKIGPAGREVRCARCGTRWHAKPIEDADGFEATPAPPPPAPAASRPRPVPVPAAAAVSDQPPGWGEDGPADSDLAAKEAPDLFAAVTTDGVDLGWDDPQDRPTRTEPQPETVEADGPETAQREPPAERDDFVAALDEPPPPAPIARSGSGTEPEPDPVAAGGDAAAAATARRLEADPLPRRPQIRVKVKKKPRSLPDFAKIDLRAAWAKSKAYVGLSLLALALVVPVIGILMRHTIVAAVPAMAGLYGSIGLEVNLRGLVFEKIETLRELDAGQPVLVVEGLVTNVTGEPRMVPTVRLALRGDDRQEIYAWSVDPKAQSLAPGASLRFRTKLASPPDEAREVYLRFTERRSRQAVLP